MKLEGEQSEVHGGIVALMPHDFPFKKIGNDGAFPVNLRKISTDSYHCSLTSLICNNFTAQISWRINLRDIRDIAL